ncbi:hypothetical protein C900_00720 [Fulvivirga imtechensis AK7]|uniref:Uncharacterized protein n=1 Tax=Fulvivirga imtechensis AK7 TaxID=1237149 RepID=L8JKW6_9BACT|nr:hypothetical protein [Fulvivirga imtechensis]ELR68144.1 hypothetical protein C900_00720 [Fulvivirga imtechensis AK7]
MKNLFPISVVCLLLLVAANVMGGNTKPHGGDNRKDTHKFEHPALDLKLLESYYSPGRAVEEEIIYKFYDSKDNLIFTTTTKVNDNKGKELSILLNKSDFLMDFQNISFYRINK